MTEVGGEEPTLVSWKPHDFKLLCRTPSLAGVLVCLCFLRRVGLTLLTSGNGATEIREWLSPKYREGVLGALRRVVALVPCPLKASGEHCGFQSPYSDNWLSGAPMPGGWNSNTSKTLHQTHFLNIRDSDSCLYFSSPGWLLFFPPGMSTCLCFCKSPFLKTGQSSPVLTSWVSPQAMSSWSVSPCTVLLSPLGLLLALTVRQALRLRLVKGPDVSVLVKFGNPAQSSEEPALEESLLPYLYLESQPV